MDKIQLLEELEYWHQILGDLETNCGDIGGISDDYAIVITNVAEIAAALLKPDSNLEPLFGELMKASDALVVKLDALLSRTKEMGGLVEGRLKMMHDQLQQDH